MPKPGNDANPFNSLCLFLTKYSLCGTFKRGDYQSKHRGISQNVFVLEKSIYFSHCHTFLRLRCNQAFVERDEK